MPETTGRSGEHLTPDALRAFLSDAMAPEEAETAAAHLERCAACMRALEDIETTSAENGHDHEGATTMSTPTLIREPEANEPVWDERRMKRSVRRTLLGTAVRAALLLLAGAIVVQLVGGLLVGPLLVDRGDRVPSVVAATFDLPVLTIPGAEVGEFDSRMGALRRTTEVSVGRAVGASSVPLGSFSTRIGPVGAAPVGGPAHAFGPVLDTPSGTFVQDVPPFEPERLGEGTAATVELHFGRGVTVTDADAIADEATDVELLWVGFRVPGGDPLDRSWRLGYSACGTIPEWVLDQRSMGFGGSGGFRTWEGDAGADHALGQVRRAVENLAVTGLVSGDGSEGPLADPGATATLLAETEPEVMSVVLTGPTDALAEVVEAVDPLSVDLLEVDFDRGAPDPCG
jgi:hypothetical protein